MYMENLGVQDLGKIELAIRGESGIPFKSGKAETNISSLVKELDEENHPSGAFFCEYTTFQQIYRVECRRLKRTDCSECVILFTLKKRRPYGEGPDDGGLQSCAGALEKAIGESLRIGDMYSRYNDHQYIVFLPCCTREDGEKAANRIVERFETRKSAENIRKFEIYFGLEKVKSVI